MNTAIGILLTAGAIIVIAMQFINRDKKRADKPAFAMDKDLKPTNEMMKRIIG